MMGGSPGPLRFAQPLLASQITWLIPLAIVGGFVAAWRIRWRRPLSPEATSLLLWAGWLGTHWVVFSFAQGIFHEYYSTIMGPAVAALAGVGTVALIREWREAGRGYLPMALILTAGWQAYLIWSHPDVRPWLLPTIGAGVFAGVLGLLVARRLAGRRGGDPWTAIAAGIGVGAVMVSPAYWSLSVVLAPANPVMPAADPSRLTGRPDVMPPVPFGLEGHERLIDFLRANHHGERIMLAGLSAMEVAPVIIHSGEPAVSLGGFMGADPVVSPDNFRDMVQAGQVRFVLLGGPGSGGGPPGGGPGGAGEPLGGGPPLPGPFGPNANADLVAWIREHGKVVESHLWQDEDKDEPEGLPQGRGPMARLHRLARLYDCNPGRGRLLPAPIPFDAPPPPWGDDLIFMLEQDPLMKLSLVIPVFNEEEVLPTLLGELGRVLEGLDCEHEIIFVDDGSRDSSRGLLAEAAKADTRIKVLGFSRNFGHQAAITAGLDFSSGDAVVVMDADLQDPPDLLPEMLAYYRQGFDVVSAQRVSREGEGPFKRATASLFYGLMRRAVDPRLQPQVGDFRLFSRTAVTAIRGLREQHRFLRGMIAWLGLREAIIPFHRPARVAGTTKYPAWKMMQFAWTAISSFSALPLKLSLIAGLLLSASGLAYSAWVIYEALVLKTTVRGWSSLVCLQLLFCGAVLVALGLVGDYVARIYEEVKGRPLYVLTEAINLSPGFSPPARVLAVTEGRPIEASRSESEAAAFAGFHDSRSDR